MKDFKKMFPMFKYNPDIVYLDNAALAFKPYEVIEAGNEFYEKYSISTRTADSTLGIKVAQDLQITRKIIANFVDANENEMIFTSGTTDSLNQVAKMLSEVITEGEIIFTYYNHSSNIVPFIENFKNKNIKFTYVDSNEELLAAINENTKIVAMPQVTNNFHVYYNMKEIYQTCKKYGTILVNDAAQAVVHEKVSINEADVIVFSSNKLFGPTGMGALVIKESLIDKLSPKKWGGGQVQAIGSGCDWTSRNTMVRFEPGTPNLAGIFQFKAAIEFINKVGYQTIQDTEVEIAKYLYDELMKVPNLEMASHRGDRVLLFNLKNIPAQDVASFLGHRNVYVRSGTFCAHKFKELPKYNNSYIRASIAFYNTKEDVDHIVSLLKHGGDFLDFL
ncbi:aminotransferase class V-fold PLP-dependent enzyme [Metamycoplasma neophronis]|uniref:Aminotransferase class V-fold PLP-dependent enzyme n=1 Tax=Metamycoplasma neophronis TaxID=872983 RepID=A0ABY2Z0E4_9BACT|nr:aminotransferase class V-fold PLP-dependent enzyme [Metamycoplasma neophronis]TPR54355.1 aminotransferase class V-fold PLP-dependent enzyme [Metamycoplasma neophronis]